MQEPQYALCVNNSRLQLPYGQWRPYLLERDITDDPEVNLGKRSKQIALYVTLIKHGQGIPLVLTYQTEEGHMRAVDDTLATRLRPSTNLTTSIGFSTRINRSVPALAKPAGSHPKFFYERQVHNAVVFVLAEATIALLMNEFPNLFVIEEGTNKGVPLNRDVNSNLDEFITDIVPTLFTDIIQQIDQRPFMTGDGHLGLSIVLHLDQHAINPSSEFLPHRNPHGLKWMAASTSPKLLLLTPWSQQVLRELQKDLVPDAKLSQL